MGNIEVVDLKKLTEEQLLEIILKNIETARLIRKEVEVLTKKITPDSALQKQPILKHKDSKKTEKKFLEEVNYYFLGIDRLKEDETTINNIRSYLPTKKNNNYQNIILRIKAELLRNIKEINELICEEQASLSFSDFSELKREIELNRIKIKLICQIEEEKQIDMVEEESNSFIFVTTQSGNIKVLEEISHLPIEYYNDFLRLFNSIKDGSFKGVKRIRCKNYSNFEICEVRDKEARVLFTRLGKNDYALISAFVKKTNKNNGYLARLQDIARDYKRQKDILKRNCSNSEFRSFNAFYEQELFNCLNKNEYQKRMRRKK